MDALETRVIHRDLRRSYPTLVRGEGIYLFDTEGNRYIDGSGGSAAVTAIGHALPEVVEAMVKQAAQLAYAPTHAFTTEPIEECARLIIEEFAPPGFGKVWFVSGGSEAAENAIKMVIQYHRERGKGTKHLIIGRRQSYHGATIAALAVGGNAGRRSPYASVLPPAEHISACNPYRDSDPDARADELERAIVQLGADNVAAFIAEPLVGATLGAMPASPGYFARIREICDRHEVLFIADEVMTGFGRTGRPWGLDHWDVTPDLIICAKGISGGYAPLGAVLARPEFVGEIRSRSGSFVVGHTSSGNPLATAVGVAVLTYLLEHGLIENAARVGGHFKRRLRELAEHHDIIGDVRGEGLLLGVELVIDREAKLPFPQEWGVSKRVAGATLARGLVSYPGAGTYDGILGDHLLYAPPLTISEAQVDDLIAILDESLRVVRADLARSC
ncbi:MAG: aspartate aminotransferase family protein [Thermomicrobiales bacterium]|nr:aspartate aminotransferase family protein [Thermomicrobiales bacterium]